MSRPRSFAALLALAAALALLSACGGSPATPAAPTAAPAVAATPAPAAPTAAPEPTTAPEPTIASTVAPAAAAPADVRAAIVAAVEALSQRGPYRMTISSTLDAGSAELLVVPPDRSHFTTSSQGQSVEVITVGATSYVLNPGGAWQTVASSESGMDTAAPITAADLADIKDPQALGQQTINGVSATGYSFGSAADPATTSTIWVGPDGAPVQLTAISEGQATTFDIAYDSSITVEPPTP